MLFILNLSFDVYVEEHYFFLAHSIIESAAVLIAAMIFIIGLSPLKENRTLRSTILASGFLATGLLEFAHLVTIDGTFAQSLPNSAATSYKLTLAAQIFAAVGLLSFAFCPIRDLTKRTSRLIYVAFAIASVALTTFFILTTEETSNLLEKNAYFNLINFNSEVLIASLLAITGTKLFSNSFRNNSNPTLTIATATLTLAMSAILFGTYQHVNDFSSLTGHLYKISAYILLYRALVLKNIKQPYEEILDLEQRIEATLNALPDLTFETSIDGQIYDYHSNLGHDTLLADPLEFVGKNLKEFLPDDASKTALAAMQEANEKGYSYGKQYSLMHADGEHRYEISASSLPNSNNETRFAMLVRDITLRYSLTQRLEGLLSLNSASDKLSEHAIAQLGLDILERLTKSKVSFLHFLSADEHDIELVSWGSETEARFCKAEQESHYPLEKAGIWADCVKTRLPVVINDYINEATKKGLPDGHSELSRFVSVPIFDGERIAMIIGNAEYQYSNSTVKIIELFGKELFQMLLRRHAQNESEKNRLLLESALENIPVGVAITTRGKDARFEYFNHRFPTLYGVNASDLSNIEAFLEAAIEDKNLRYELLETLNVDIAHRESKMQRWDRIEFKGKGNTLRYLNIQTVQVSKTDLNVTLVEDVTESIQIEEEVRVSATAFSSQEGILITDANLQILRVNAAFERCSGYSANELVGKTPAFLQSGSQTPEFYKAMWEQIDNLGVWRGEIINKSKDGRLAPFSLTISAVKNKHGAITHFVADYIDLSDIKSAQNTISRLSYFDNLTGLPNRESLKSMLSSKQLISHSADGFIGALMIDLDNFRTINETLGHESGDELLIEVAKRLQNVLRSGDKVARFGGDDFVILFMELGADEEQASLKTQLLAQSVVYSLEDTYVIGKNAYFSTASIGATLVRASKPNSREIFKQLDIALSSAKSDGKNQIRFFDPAWQDSVNKRAHLLDELRIAIKERQLELFYQPQLNEHGKIIGCEGLIRWNHPTRGLLPPSEFLPIAQENHLMIRIGDEVLRMGLEQLHHWQQHSAFKGIQLSLNITADQFYEERFEKHLLTLLSDLSITPGSLMLEFTESMILGGVDAAREKIIRLNTADIEFAIDDFGTGYSSLSYLSTLPMDQLKIDQSFVRSIGIIETDTQIVKAIITMAKILKLGVIAEGVETQAQFDYLKSQDCELFQGYLFSKPVPIAEFDQLVLNATCEQQ